MFHFIQSIFTKATVFVASLLVSVGLISVPTSSLPSTIDNTTFPEAITVQEISAPQQAILEQPGTRDPLSQGQSELQQKMLSDLQNLQTQVEQQQKALEQIQNAPSVAPIIIQQVHPPLKFQLFRRAEISVNGGPWIRAVHIQDGFDYRGETVRGKIFDRCFNIYQSGFEYPDYPGRPAERTCPPDEADVDGRVLSALPSVANVPIVIQVADVSWEAVTDTNGEFSINLPPDCRQQYGIQISMKNPAPHRVAGMIFTTNIRNQIPQGTTYGTSGTCQ